MRSLDAVGPDRRYTVRLQRGGGFVPGGDVYFRVEYDASRLNGTVAPYRMADESGTLQLLSMTPVRSAAVAEAEAAAAAAANSSGSEVWHFYVDTSASTADSFVQRVMSLLALVEEMHGDARMHSAEFSVFDVTAAEEPILGRTEWRTTTVSQVTQKLHEVLYVRASMREFVRVCYLSCVIWHTLR